MDKQTMAEAGYPTAHGFTLAQQARITELRTVLEKNRTAYTLHRHELGDTQEGCCVYITAECAPPRLAILLAAAGLLPQQIKPVGGRIAGDPTPSSASRTTVQMLITY